jgi:hypothetical protein
MDKVNLGKQRQIRLDAVPVRKWLAIVSNGDNRSTISLRLGISERSLYRIEVQSTKVDVSLAEIIAEAANCRDEFYALLGEPGVIGWSKAGHRYCVECGTWWRKHRAKGMCARCYIRTWQAKKFSYRTKSPDMWSHDYAKCRRCSTTKHKHRARGFCGPCYNSIRLTARSLRVPLPGYIDSYDIMIT